jgi:DNA-binding cell septation regulator SpoVG
MKRKLEEQLTNENKKIKFNNLELRLEANKKYFKKENNRYIAYKNTVFTSENLKDLNLKINKKFDNKIMTKILKEYIGKIAIEIKETYEKVDLDNLKNYVKKNKN